MTTHNSNALTTLDESFGDSIDDVVQPTLEENPWLKWMTGNLSTTDRKVAVGWHVRSGVNPVLDRLLTAMGVEHYVVQHKTGNERLVPYWNLSWDGHPCSLIVVAYGVKSPWQMKRDLGDRAGIAYGVGTARDDEGNIQYKDGSDQPKQRPQMQLRAFVHELVGTNERPEEGFNEWFKVSVSNYMVDHLYRVLNAQYPVIDAYNAIMMAKQNPNRAKYWGFSIPTGIGEEGQDVGPDKDHQSTIIPMVPQIPPLRVGTPETIAYLNTRRIPLHIQRRLLDSLLEETVVWSMQRSVEIVEGKQDQAMTVITEEPITVTPVQLPQLPAASDPLITAEQVDWIRKTYCGENANTIKQICQHFGVTDLTQLHVSHYTLLFNQVR
ncbi:hypothetical protein KSF_107320 [Reticulibacter mediterranei]|uniref:Uncharacterized protein n=1 Tax=Reticulibacter mediterranei TaxID=2778369 RepID=A0A8J3IZ92_9CHLR|nr:hypothetical protein [Reticulibacter mediterranei]GHP00685.1 hypothetical protein KSF_107320 [Reticulibacter mediterranei]